MAVSPTRAVFYTEEQVMKVAGDAFNTTLFLTATPKSPLGFPTLRGKKRTKSLTLSKFPSFKDEPRGISEILDAWVSVRDVPMHSERPTKFSDLSDPIESSWKEVVHNAEKLDSREYDQQTAIWELIETEYRHILHLETIRDLFLSALNYLKTTHNLLQGIEADDLFGQVNSLHCQHCILWNKGIRPILVSARCSGYPLDLTYLGDGFLHVSSILAPYRDYCHQHRNRSANLTRKIADNEQFRNFIEWCEGRDEAQRLRMSDWLMKPVQRITKYQILFEAILGKTDKPEHKEKIKHIIAKISSFVSEINGEIRTKEEEEGLLHIYNRIVGFELFDPFNDEVSKILGEYPSWDTVRQMESMVRSKKFVREFPVKIKSIDKNIDLLGRYDGVILVFSDFVLFCRRTGKKKSVHGALKISQPVMELDKVKVHELREPGACLWVVTGVAGTVDKAFVVYCNNSQQQTALVETIRKAQDGVTASRAPLSASPLPTIGLPSIPASPEILPLMVPMQNPLPLSSVPQKPPRNPPATTLPRKRFANHLRRSHSTIELPSNKNPMITDFDRRFHLTRSSTPASSSVEDLPAKFKVFRRFSDGDAVVPSCIPLLRPGSPKNPAVPLHQPLAPSLRPTDSITDFQKKRRIAFRKNKLRRDHRRFLSDTSGEKMTSVSEIPRRTSWALGDSRQTISEDSANEDSFSVLEETSLRRLDSGFDSQCHLSATLGDSNRKESPDSAADDLHQTENINFNSSILILDADEDLDGPRESNDWDDCQQEGATGLPDSAAAALDVDVMFNLSDDMEETYI